MKALKSLVLAALLAVSVNANAAAPAKDYFQTETYAAARMTYQMLLNGLEITETEVITHQEPAICYPFPLDYNEFYRAIQVRVNERVEALPTRERGRVAPLVGWYVWNAVQLEWGC